MHNRKMWVLTLVLVLVMASMSACAMGEATTADCEVDISVDNALAAQNAGMAGLAAGSVEWSESELSSFLTVLLQQNTGANFPVDSIHACVAPDNAIAFFVQLKDDVLLGSDTLALAGTIGVTDGQIAVDLSEASANGFVASSGLLAPINAQINGALSGAVSGLPVSVETTEDTLTISLGGM
ncbi:MAG: hypothetical protein KF832_15590 [Caldilineaceae bacterium]|nr:hypothetical protein [Caldilineaceae bacterium]